MYLYVCIYVCMYTVRTKVLKWSIILKNIDLLEKYLIKNSRA